MGRIRIPRRRLGGIVTWALVCGLGAVLAAIAAIAVSGALSGSRAVDDVRHSGDLAGAYLRAQDAFSREDAIEDVYKDDPDPMLRPAFADAAADLDEALAALLRAGGPRDRALAKAARPVHREYAAAMWDVLDAADRGDADAAEAINEERADPAQDTLQPLINGQGPSYALGQLGEIDALDRTQQRILDRTALIVPIGVVLYLLLLAMLVALRRRLERSARRELSASRELARTDELTGMGNRRHFYEAVAAALAGGEPAAVLLIDIDRFKEINDTLGHHVGDQLLCQVAPRLERVLAEATVRARLGGDEFVALLPAPADAVAAAEALIAGLDEPFELDGLLTHVRASVGIALHPDHGGDAAELLRHADVAMYRAKAAGGGVEVYADRDENRLDRVVLLGELHAALDGEQLVLHYQPKADLATGDVAAVEALIRWQHPTRGLLPPAAFLPLAEQHGLMHRLTLRVLEQSAAQSVAWERDGRPLRIAVNLAPANLLDLRFPDAVAEVLRRSGARAELLQLEITEDTIMVDPVRVLDVVARLGELGLAFALDDFGSGYSSLAYLKRLPVQELKIDRSFVIDMDDSPDDDVIVRSTIDLARNLGLRVVAEGVETGRTWDRLVQFGCHAAQGFFLAPALPPAELDAWLDARVRPGSAPARPAHMPR
jgi:diguanylate cyclase (GGDEF)-like protein